MVTEELIIKCIAGEAEQHELLMVENWRKEATANEQMYQQVLKIWDHSAELESASNIDVEAAWTKVQTTIAKPATKVFAFNRVWLAAASIILILGLGIVFYRSNTASVDMVSVVTQNKQQLTLNDGSKITVLRGEFDYPKTFEGKKRQVVLKSGTAYFDIEKDSLHPFEITCSKTNVTVLGTEFEIKREDNHVKVTVNEGKVRFTTPSGVSILTRGMTADFNESTGALNTNTGSIKNETAYATGKFNFNNTSIKQVLTELGAYDKSYTFDVPTPLQSCKITAEFDIKEGMGNVMAVIAATLGSELKVDRNGKHFTLVGGGCIQ